MKQTKLVPKEIERQRGREPVPIMKFEARGTKNPKEVERLGFIQEFNCECMRKTIRDKHSGRILYQAICRAGFPSAELRRII